MERINLMKLDIINNSGLSDTKIHIGILGQNNDNTYGYFETVKGTTSFKVLSNTSTDPVQVPFYTLKTLKNALTITDYVNSARVFVAVDIPPLIPIWKDNFVGPTFCGPDALGTLYDKVEFTFNINGDGTEFCGCNTTAVDFFAIPMTLKLKDGNTTVGPVGITSMQGEIFEEFQSYATLKGLILDNGDGIPVRILSPGHGIDCNMFEVNYLEAAIDEVWKYYATPGKALSLNPTPTVPAYAYSGTVVEEVFTFNAPNVKKGHTITKPSTKDVFYCNGVFDGAGSGEDFIIDANIKNQVASALNRGILPLAPAQELCDSSKFYDAQKTSNPYSARLHEVSKENLCYAFPYDDQCNQSTYITLDSPSTMTLSIESLGWPA